MKNKVFFSLAILALFLILLRFFDSRPLHLAILDDGDLEKKAGPAEKMLESDFLLLHWGNSEETGSFETTDWSLAWANTLEQEIGPFSLWTKKIPENLLQRFRAVIITRETARRLSREDLRKITSFVEEGGSLFLDQPPALLKDLSGVHFDEKRKFGKKFTHLKKEAVPSPFHEPLRSLPLYTSFHPPLRKKEDVEVLLSIDWADTLFRRMKGKGNVITLGFDFPMAITALQQGIPAKGSFRVEKTLGFYDYIIEPEDLLQDRSLLTNPYPFADILERMVLSTALRSGPLPRWWYFPHGHEGAFIMTHDEDEAGPSQMLPMIRYEKEKGFTSTTFLVAHPRLEEEWAEPENHLQKVFRLEGDVQLHWNRFPMPHGIWKIEPLKNVFSLTGQRDLLNRFLGAENEIVANRTHYLVCGDHYSRTFRILEKAGVEIDVSFGPNRGGKGYLFGTGLPFHPMDTDGKLFSLLELPFETQEDWGEVDRAFFEKLFSQSRELFHQCIIPIIHPHLIVKEKDGEALWKCTYDLAKKNNHWITNVREFLHFYKNRISSPLTSSWDGSTLIIHSKSLVPGMAVTVPLTVNGKSFLRAEAKQKENDYSLHISAGGREAAIAVPEGDHVLKVYYGEKK